MFRAKSKNPQPELFIPAHKLIQPSTSAFFAKLDQTLQEMSFAQKVRQLCAPAYAETGPGRPGVDPAVYFKMLLIGFFENISSERAIAERCRDSISIRAFLGYELTEDTPDHSTLSVIRQRLSESIYQAVFMVIMEALQTHGLLKGRNLGIDASVIEANASLKGLVHRNTQEAYWDYVKRLAAENGIDPSQSEAVRNFDRKRPKKMSNDDWENPHDPDAKIGPTKSGHTDMIYKPENTTDLDTGIIVQAEVRPGNEADSKDLAVHILEAQQNINQVRGQALDTLSVQSVTGDKGYHSIPELGSLQAEQIKTIIADPTKNRRLDKLPAAEAQTVKQARKATASLSGKKLLRKRGMHLEPTFAHMLDAGGLRRTTLRGLANLNKRYKLAAAFYNLSQLMRKLWGIGTPKQWAAGAKAHFLELWTYLVTGLSLADHRANTLRISTVEAYAYWWCLLSKAIPPTGSALTRLKLAENTKRDISTGC